MEFIPTSSANQRVSVFPIIDVQTGQVQFRSRGSWATFYVVNPQQLLQALAHSARTVLFDPQTQDLLIFVASRGKLAGEPRAFSLAKFPQGASLTKLSW